jgi:hypothetical protein
LRLLLIAVTACCLVVGFVTNWGDKTGWGLVIVISPGVAAAILACLVRLSIDSSVPSRQQLFAFGVVGMLIVQVLSALQTDAPINAAYVLCSILTSLSLSLWVAGVSVWTALRFEHDSALLAELRQAARLSLFVVGSALLVSALLLATAFSIRGVWESERDMIPIRILVACAGMVAALPWIRVVRRRGVVHRRFGIPEYLSVAALVVSTMLAILAMAATVVIRNTEWSGPRTIFFGRNDALLAGYFYPIVAASVLAVTGVVLELWRDQWHPRLTAVAVIGVSAHWLGTSFCYAAVK